MASKATILAQENKNKQLYYSWIRHDVTSGTGMVDGSRILLALIERIQIRDVSISSRNFQKAEKT